MPLCAPRRRRLKYVRRTPLRLEFGIWDLEFPGQARLFLVPACPGCGSYEKILFGKTAQNVGVFAEVVGVFKKSFGVFAGVVGVIEKLFGVFAKVVGSLKNLSECLQNRSNTHNGPFFILIRKKIWAFQIICG